MAEKPAVVAEEKPAEATAVAATEPPSGKGRVLSDISPEAQHINETIAKQQAKNIAAIPKEGEPTEEGASKGKKWTKPELAAFDENNKAADKVSADHPLPESETPEEKLDRAKAMVNAAKGDKVNIPTQFGEASKHGPSVLLLREAKDLVSAARTGTREERAKAFSRFTVREGLIREGRFKEALEDRIAEGAESRALGSPEGAADRESSEEEPVGRAAEAGAEAEHVPGAEGGLTAEEHHERQQEEGVVEARERPKVVTEAKEGKDYTVPTFGKRKPIEVAKAGERQKLAGFAPKGEAAKKISLAKKLTPESKSKSISESLREGGDEDESEARSAGETKQPDTVTIPHKKTGADVEAKVNRSTTLGEALKQSFREQDHAKFMRPALRKLVSMITRVVGDTPVHYVDDSELANAGRNAYGLYDSKKNHIVMNDDYSRYDSMLHEGFHALTSRLIDKSPELSKLISRLGGEVADYLNDNPDAIKGIAKKDLRYALSDVKEFITHVMTNKEFQNLLRRVKISDDLSKALGIPKWRLSTAFNGLIDAIRSHLGMSPRDTSVIEGAMSITEDIARTQSPNEAVEAGVAGGRGGMDESEISPEARKRLDDGDRGAFYRNPREIAEAVKGINAAAVKGIGKDLLTNKSAAFLKGHLNWLPGNYVEELHGHLFEDAKGHIIDAINTARNKVASTYRDLYRASADLRAQAYLTDRRYASQMPDYSDLVARSVRYNIHAEKVPTAPGKNREDVQRDANWAKAHEDYNKLPPALQRRYVAEKKFMIDSKKAEAEDILRNTIPLYDAPKGMTHEEAIKRALDNNLDADHWEHYEKEGADGYIRDAMRQMSGKDVYANSQRSEDERYVVHGRYDMPSGGSAKSMTGEDLPDNQREFATEKEMRDYAAATPLHAKMRDVAYVKDANGKLTDVYPKTPETEKPGLAGKRVRMADAEATGHRVTLERADMETATDKAEGDRKRATMEAAGVKELTGVLDRRDDKTWGKINTPQQKVLERRINSQSQLNDVSKQDLIKQTRQMALASANSYSGHQMMRRKVFGADFSSADGLADYAKASAQRAARMAHRAELDEAMTRMDDHVKANEGNSDTSLRMTSVANNMWSRVHSDTLNRKINPTMHKIMAYAFTNFLVRPSHILLQQLHNYVYTVPHVASRAMAHGRRFRRRTKR